MSTTTSLNLREKKTKLCQRLVNNWHWVIAGFPYLEKIIGELYEMSQKGERFSPKLSGVLQPFEACDLPNIRVVVLLENPAQSPAEETLMRWGSQGVLVLGSSLTLSLSHRQLDHLFMWSEFVKTVGSVINSIHSDVVYCFIGNAGSSIFRTHIDPKTNYVLEGHPVFDSNVQQQINGILAMKDGANAAEIIW